MKITVSGESLHWLAETSARFVKMVPAQILIGTTYNICVEILDLDAHSLIIVTEATTVSLW